MRYDALICSKMKKNTEKPKERTTTKTGQWSESKGLPLGDPCFRPPKEVFRKR